MKRNWLLLGQVVTVEIQNPIGNVFRVNKTCSENVCLSSLIVSLLMCFFFSSASSVISIEKALLTDQPVKVFAPRKISILENVCQPDRTIR